MPIQPDPQVLSVWPHQINVPHPDMFVTVQMQQDPTRDPVDVDALQQDLIDYLQEWPGKLAGADVTGILYNVRLYNVLPTDPEEQPTE
jgi:hypothetical protein